MKKIPERTCIVCRTKKDKSEFIRIVKTKEDIVLDKTGKVAGRGAYICDSLECINKCKKTHALNRAFKQEVSEQTYTDLVNNYEQN